MKTNATILKETTKAIFASFYYNGNQYNGVWLPKSKVELTDVVKHDKCQGATIHIPNWLLNKISPTNFGSDSNSAWVQVFESQYTPEIG